MTVKPGYLTTEFWVTALTSIAALIAALTSNLNPRYAAIGAAISEGLYALSRAITKHGVALSHRPVVAPAPTQPVTTGPTATV